MKKSNIKPQKTFEAFNHDKGDHFFKTNTCDRCNQDIKNGRIMSWFTNDTICMECKADEDLLRKQLPKNGKDYEGCGYIPSETN